MGVETMAILSLVGTGLGTVMQMVGQQQQAKSQASQMRYQAQVSENNAKIARQNAEWSAHASEQKVAEEGQKTRQTVGAIKAAQAASGVDVNTGSAVDVRSGAAETGQLNAITLRSNAARQAYGYLTDETGAKAQAELDRSSASNTEAALPGQMVGTLIGGVTSAAGNYTQMKQNGVFS